MKVHEDWTGPVSCPECEGHAAPEGEAPCYRCGGAGVLDVEVEPEPPVPVPAAVCPKCKGPAELRKKDNARWCRVCDTIFYHAHGWPDILDVLNERES